jgi:hypothetical protein
MSQLASDSFIRGSYPQNPLNTHWQATGTNPAFQVASVGVCQAASASTDCVMNNIAVSWPPDQYSEITVSPTWMNDNGYMGPVVRSSGPGGTAGSYYACWFGNPTTDGSYYLRYYNNGLQATLHSAPITIAAGDVLRLEIQGTTLVLKRNGSVLTTQTDANLASGNPGMFIGTGNHVDSEQISLWAGGDFISLHAISGSAGLAGATVTLSGDASASTTADGSGNYSFASLADGNYVVTPSSDEDTFTPTSRNETVSGADITGVNFTASLTPHSISGNAGVPYATVTLSGDASASTTASVSGSYSLVGLADGNYVVTPTKLNFTFSPTTHSETVNDASITGVNFTATFVPPAGGGGQSSGIIKAGTQFATQIGSPQTHAIGTNLGTRING